MAARLGAGGATGGPGWVRSWPVPVVAERGNFGVECETTRTGTKKGVKAVKGGGPGRHHLLHLSHLFPPPAGKKSR